MQFTHESFSLLGNANGGSSSTCRFSMLSSHLQIHKMSNSSITPWEIKQHKQKPT